MRNFFLISLLFFSFSNARSQSITVTAPNGGEVLYACQTFTITWTSAGTSNFYDIDYSLNNGSTWASVATNINVLNGQYSWTVPNVESNTCLVRVKDKNDATKFDISNAVFTIHIPVIVTSPNGGESWQAGSQQLITWNIQGTSLTFNIDYSTDNGSTWNTVTSSLSTSVGSYNWIVPNTPSTTCLVRVRDAVTNCMQDVSNNIFTITAAQPILTYPNGGEQFQWGETVTITWNQSTFYSTVRLEYSIDNGVTWNLITSGTANDGSQGWSTPYNTSGQCLIKASNSANVNSNDVSNAVFSIVKPLTITAPNGGESLLGCNNFTITMNKAANVSGTVWLEYSTDGGSTWNYITNFSNFGSSFYSYNWTLPNGISSNQCFIRAYNTSQTGMADTSNAAFTIQPNNVITVTAPNGGESIAALMGYVITWMNTPGASGLYNVEYSSDNGSTWNTLATGVSGNTYNWTNIPNVPGTTYLVRVSDNANTCKNDVSNANFTVTAAQPVLLTPNGGEIWWSSFSNSITWNPSTFYSTVRLEYSLDNGVTWQLITSSTSNDGQYSWSIDNVNSINCLIKASNTANTTISDISNAVFTIKPVVKIFTPNGLDQLGACTQTSITFEHSPTYTSFSIDYSINGGISWNTVVSNQTFGGTTGSYNWTMPNVPTTKALIRVYPGSSLTYADQSDSTFSIRPAVSLTQPNYGGILQPGTVYPVKWTTDGISNLYDIAYSTSGNTGPWTNIIIGYNTATNTYNWTVPNIPSNNCYIRIRDNANSCKEDISNLAFVINGTASPITVTSNGGDTLKGCQNFNITWSESGAPLGSYNIDLSADGGQTWSNIVSNYATTSGLYNWIVPNISTNEALVRVSSSTVSTINDVSNLAFVIQGRSVKAAPDTIICSGTAITLRATGGTGTFVWSPSNNLNNINIANPVATPGSSVNYVVTSANGSCIMTDTASITVQQQPAVNITSDFTDICGSQVATFTANVTGGGTIPVYQWRRNSFNVGSNSRFLSINNINDKDTISCTVSYVPSCFAPVKSNVIVMNVISKPNLGNDTVINISSPTATINLNTVYNTTGLAYAVWNTTNPAAAGPGIYRLVVCKLSGCTCPDSDTAFVNVNLVSGREARVCAKGNTKILSSITGASYQWQVNRGAGFVNIQNDDHHAGVTSSQLTIANVLSDYYGYQYRCLVNGGLVSDVYTVKITAQWTGFANKDWENPANWGCGSVPDANTDVYIYSGKPNYPEINCNRICRSVNATPGTSLKVTDGKIFYIKGN